ARYWDMVGNSGNFIESTPLIWSAGQASGMSQQSKSAKRETGWMPVPNSPFLSFLRFSDWLYTRAQRTDSIALSRLMELLFEFLTGELRLDPNAAAKTLWRDYRRGGRHDKPSFLKPYLSDEKIVPERMPKPLLPKRQARHLV
ncbi:MAG TPA: B12-binding domain-containing radical SAM protein, partial [Verrucomicrobiae bacterium]|nr:B12-binding domain-containing radical SAM protein [Verrucomicrobiae bacterium]